MKAGVNAQMQSFLSLFLSWEGCRRISLLKNATWIMHQNRRKAVILSKERRIQIIEKLFVLKCLNNSNSWLITRCSQILLTSWKMFGKQTTFYLNIFGRIIEISLVVLPGAFFSAFLSFIRLGGISKKGILLNSFENAVYTNLANALKKCGGAFIKAGQWASTRPDIFPDELCAQLSVLHSNSIPHSFDWTLLVLGPLIPDIIHSIEPTPIGCGTVAQVYRGHLADGRQVAIKILHPNILETIKVDLRILKVASRILQFIVPPLKWINLPSEIDSFSRIMVEQCDLRQEYYNLQCFDKNFSSPLSKISFPAVIFSNKQVLIESLENGIPMQQFIQSSSFSDKTKKKMARLLFKALMKMILKDNFIHADLHPGNVLVTKDTRRLIFLDVGLATKLNSRDYRNFIDLFSAIVIHQDGYAAGKLLIERSHPKSQLTVIDKEGFCKEIEVLVAKVTNPSRAFQTLLLSRISFSEIFHELLISLKKHHVKLNENYANIIMSILCIEGIGRQLSHGIDLLPLLKDVANLYVKHS